jgi:hypothetical protein
MIEKNVHKEGAVNYFVVSKPLQFFVVRSILKQRSGDSVILLVGAFDESRYFFDFIRNSFPEFREVLYFNLIREAVHYAVKNKTCKLYLPSDVGFVWGVELFLLRLLTPEIYVSVYEEGNGFYVTTLYKGAKKAILEKLGFGVYFGGCFFTQNILVYNKEKYQNLFPSNLKNIELINLSLAKTILHEMSYYDSWYYDKFLKNFTVSKKVNIIFFNDHKSTDLGKQIIFFKNKFSKVDCTYYKFHPTDCVSDLDNLSSLLNEDFLKYPACVPAEYFLLKLLSMHIQINAYHHNSSIAFYLNDYNINFFNMTGKVK